MEACGLMEIGPTDGHEATAEAALQPFSGSWHGDGESS